MAGARMNEALQTELSRRAFLGQSAGGLGSVALGTLLNGEAAAGAQAPHFAPKAKRVIYLFMSGGPSHVDTFDPKPLLTKRHGQPMPAEIIRNHQFAMIKERTPRIKGSPWKFKRHGQSGISVSELFPHVAGVVDELAVVRSLHTDTFNHDPAVMFLNTGNVRFGWPSLGAWTSYGLGTENENLPAFVVLVSGKNVQPLLDSYWGAGFLPAEHQGTPFRAQGTPVLYLQNPRGISPATRAKQIELIGKLNQWRQEAVGDPAIAARIRQYELAFRMQTSVPELADLASEPESVRKAYGAEPGKVSFANNCLLARRLCERGVRFVQLFEKGWDSHGNIAGEHAARSRAVDRPIAALLRDLKARGLLDETLVVWGGEFGRTPMAQGSGRDHHPHGFTMWLAGGGVRPGIIHGATDEFGYFAADHRVHVHDFNATLLHLLGLDHEKLTYRHAGRDFRLTDVHGHVVKELLG
ncbi:MAG: sulfatase [Verrucomicrobiales bacterium]|nr:sulfatase [Verrucomicrobiales bacterium]